MERWDAGRVLEELRLNGWISQATYSAADRTRMLRNKILHQGQPVTPDDADACVQLALRRTAEEGDLPEPTNRYSELDIHYRY